MLDRPASIIEGFTRGTHLLRAGLCDEALVEFQSVYVEADAVSDTDLMASCLCEMGWCTYKLGRAEEALECAMGARRLWERQNNLVELSRALAVESIVLLDLGFSDEAYDLAERAVQLADANGDAAVLAFALNAKGIVLAVCHETELGLALIERAAAIAEGHGNTAAQAYYVLNIGYCHARTAEEADSLGKPDWASAERDEAINLFDRARILAEASGDHWTLRAALGNSAEMYSLQGRNEDARDCLERCAAVPGEPGASLRIQYLYTLSDLQLRSGDLQTARTAAIQALAMADSSQQIDHQVNALSRLAGIHEALGDSASALTAFKRYHASYVMQAGETARRRGRIEEIRSETRQLRSQAAKLADQALNDPLTGIANRRSFDQILNRLAGTPISVAIIDLDHFKAVNDQFSHIVGDAVLQRVARVIVGQIGAHGHAARLGGEEFGLIFPNSPEATAAAVCEGIRYAIAATHWSDLAPGLAVTASIGLATGDGATPSGELMQSADNRLYAAKTNGRDGVVSNDALVLVPSGTPGERRRWRA